MNKSKLTLNVLVRSAILAALSVMLRRYLTVTIPVNQKIGFGYIPIMISGILYGPLAGGLTGAIADVVGMLMAPDGVFNPIFTISCFMMGFMSGVFSHYVFKGKIDKHMDLIIVFSCMFTFLVCRLLIESIWLQTLSKNPYWTYVKLRIPKQIIETIINIIIIRLILPRIKRYALK